MTPTPKVYETKIKTNPGVHETLALRNGWFEKGIDVALEVIHRKYHFWNFSRSKDAVGA